MANLLNLRRWAASRLARFVDFRIDERLRDRVEPVQDGHGRRLDALEAALEHLRGDLGWLRGELDRLMPQVAAQGTALETLREKLALAPASDEPETAEARSLIDQVRREHAQIRVRLTGIACYEDRLRKLEDSFGVTAGG